MGLKFRKSIKIAPGVRLNVGKKSAGLSFGGKGLRYSLNTRTGGRVTASLPGAGLSYSGGARPRSRTPAYRRRSELSKLQRDLEKMRELERAKVEVQIYENQIETIKSIHLEGEEPIDWQRVSASPPPFEPGAAGPNETEARMASERYKPGILERLFRRESKRRAKLAERVAAAKEADEADYRAWEDTVALAGRVLAGDPDAYLRVVREMDPFDDLAAFGSGFELFAGDDPGRVVVEFEARAEGIVPKAVKSLTKTGKLSVKEMPKTHYYALEQDYVCSCVIRIARDLFALLPLTETVVHATKEWVDPSTGVTGQAAILSVRIDRVTLDKLNLGAIDCSEAMSNFEHRMKFMATRGFQPVDKLEP
ncbi:DUF4236 domain-containing protein [Paenibacillaceae bacterium WGS1546]|uniref:DUF4236 domain-containing protein n=1 Tax=Cohnella sp. WGS1546 TaxID=3366810 RepID=UPI00372D2CE1